MRQWYSNIKHEIYISMIQGSIVDYKIYFFFFQNINACTISMNTPTYTDVEYENSPVIRIFGFLLISVNNKL